MNYMRFTLYNNYENSIYCIYNRKKLNETIIVIIVFTNPNVSIFKFYCLFSRLQQKMFTFVKCQWKFFKKNLILAQNIDISNDNNKKVFWRLFIKTLIWVDDIKKKWFVPSENFICNAFYPNFCEENFHQSQNFWIGTES